MITTKAVILSFLFGSVTRLIGGEKRIIKSAGTVDSEIVVVIYGTPQNN